MKLVHTQHLSDIFSSPSSRGSLCLFLAGLKHEQRYGRCHMAITEKRQRIVAELPNYCKMTHYGCKKKKNKHPPHVSAE